MRNVQIPSSLISELGVEQIIDITDTLPKLKPKGWDGLEAPRQLEALTDITWHHTAMFLSDNCTAETHARNHINAGEGGCPYHFYIKNGQIYQCNNVLTFTYGVKSNNYQTVHCVVEGCYSEKDGRQPDELSDADKRAMIALEMTLRGILPNYRQTQGHNYYKPTACPGYSMSKFKEEVAEAENRIAFTNTESGLNERAYSIANSILFTYNMAKGKDEYGNPVSEGNRIWARQRLLTLEPALREQGFIK